MQSSLRSQLDTQGYIGVPAVVPREQLEAVVTDTCQHIGVDLDDATTWYTLHIDRATGMVEMYHYQSMWNTRQHPQVHQVFADIFGTEKLWVVDNTGARQH